MRFRQEEKEPRGCLGWVGIVLAVIVFGVTFAMMALMFYGLVLMPVMNTEHYLQVWQNPAAVTATVTKHDSYDDEGDTDYESFITYVYDGVRYENMDYENCDTAAELTPIGTQITLQISPKDPTRQMEDLKRSRLLLPLSVALASLLLTGVYIWLQRRSLTKGCRGTPDTDMVQNDLKIKIRSRFMRPFLLLCVVGNCLVYWRYSVLQVNAAVTAASVCGLFWLWCMLTTIRDYRRVENENYQLRQDVLVDKKESSDSDSTYYHLYYQSGQRKWKASTSEKSYHKARIGDAVVAVYLPGKKKPILHYNHDGNAT